MRVGRDIAHPKLFLGGNTSLSSDPYNIWQNLYKGNTIKDEKSNVSSSSEKQSGSSDRYEEKGESHSGSDVIEEKSVSSSSTTNRVDEAVLKLLNFKAFDIFSYARHNKFAELESLFIQGLNPDSKDEFGNTILIIAAQNGNKRIVKLALRYGSRINMPNSMGNTALHFASEYNYDTVYGYLIQKGADPEQMNLRGIRAQDGLKKASKQKKDMLLGDGQEANERHAKMNKLIKKIV